MNMQMPPPSDAELAREERELAELYAHLPKAEPGAQLDARVLSKARAAVARRRPQRAPRWLVGLGTAAVLVLAAGVTWRLKPATHPPIAPQAMPEMRGAADSPADAAANAEENAPGSGSTTSPRVDAGTAAQPTSRTFKKSRDAANDEASSRAVGNLAIPASPPLPAQSMQKSMADKIQSRRNDAKSVRQRTESATGSERQAGPDDSNAQAVARPSYAAPPAPPPAPAAPPAPSEQTMQEAEQAVAPMPKASEGSEPSAVMLVEAARQALQSGDRPEATRQVRMLVSKYPQFPLPADLAPLAPMKRDDSGR